jgi:Tfp pilus assembly protein PilV
MRARRPQRPEVKKLSQHARAFRRAFTIAEVMMAAGVMALAIATAITTMQRAFLALDSARNTTIAAQIMQSEFERMRLQSWSTIDGYAAGPETLAIDPGFTANAAIGSRFTLTRSAALVHADMKRITLTLAWRGYDGREITRSFQTYYGRNGLYDYFYNSF